MDYSELKRKWGGSVDGVKKIPLGLIVAVLLVAVCIAAVGVFVKFGTPLPTDSNITNFDEDLCNALLSAYEPEVADLEYEEIYADRRLDFSKGRPLSKWKINNRGPVLSASEFLPDMPFYQSKTFFVWDKEEFEGCGIHHVLYNETKGTFKEHYLCSAGEIEGMPTEVYMEYGDEGDYYLIAYEIIHKTDSSIKSIYHVTFSSNPSDFENGLNMLDMYGCE